MSKPVVELLTIDQWMAAPPEIRSLVLNNIKLKERLKNFLKDNYSKMNHKKQAAEGGWRECDSCKTKGWVPVEPRRPGIHASQVPQPCLLRIYNEMIGLKKKDKIDFNTMITFELGHAIHDLLQSYGEAGAWGPEYLKELEISKDYQELAEELMIEGHADADNVLLIDDIPNHEFAYAVGIIHEYKSANQSNFEKLTRPKSEHKIQAMIYAAACNRPVIVFLYLNKNDSTMLDFPVAFEPEVWVHLESRLRIAKDAYDKKIPPPATTGYHCLQCGYSHLCKAYEDSKNVKKAAKELANAIPSSD